MRFSLILASRGRSDLLQKMLASIQANTIDHANIEVLIGIDTDDVETIHFCESITYPWVLTKQRDRGTNLARDYHNWLVSFAKGKYFFVLNDDVEIQTYGWDAIASLKFDMAKERTNNKTYGQTGPACGTGYSEFPMMTREAMLSLGFLMPEEYPCWGADSFLYSIFAHINFVQNMQDIRLKHHRKNDETRGQLAKRFNNRVKLGRDPKVYAKKLKNTITLL